MSCNLYKPHLHIYSEDAATHDIAIGFKQHFPDCLRRQIQVFQCGTGYASIREEMKNDAGLGKYKFRRVLCVIDFDNSPGRGQEIKQLATPGSQGRVYVVGCAGEVETAKQSVGFSGTNENFGATLAGMGNKYWSNRNLAGSKCELERLLRDLKTDGICIQRE
ncbi:MAG: hypothetical protein LBM92_08110 [Opitutaceae bacterium]|jgi:hypothetical protein|nr:hypothetical protein [Opitutaceae bacterium]